MWRDRINADINARKEGDPILDTLRKIKARAIELQNAERADADDAIRAMLDEALRTHPKTDVAYPHLVKTYGSNKLTDEDIRNLLDAYGHLSDKERVGTIVTKFRGRVSPQDVRRVMKSL